MKNQESQELKSKKILNNILKVLGGIIVLLVAYIILKVIIAALTGTIPTIFGVSLFLVQTPSMEGTIEVGDLVVVKHSSFAKAEVNDIISFFCIDPNQPIYGEAIVHRVIEITPSGELVTKGDANLAEDLYGVNSGNYIGKVIYVSTFLGKIFSGISSSYAIVFVIVIAVLLNIAVFEIKKILKLKKEENEESKEAEQERLKQELLEEIKKETKQWETKDFKRLYL